MLKAGEKIPEATLRTLGADGIETVSTSDIFKGRKVVLFAVPGAFTPTCSNDHLPSFLENAEKIREKGVDEIVCVSVNDPFVQAAWAKAKEVGDEIKFYSDGNAEFTEKIGMVLDASGFGMGKRSLRYAAVVDDGIVRALEVEENPGVTTCSSGTNILEKL